MSGMNLLPSITRTITATVDEVFAASGLAFLTDDEDREWTVTRSTPGMQLHELQPGQRVRVVVDCYPDFAVASRIVGS